MKKLLSPFLLLILATCMCGCAVIGGIFKAGVAVGIISIVVVIAVIIWVISLLRGKK